MHTRFQRGASRPVSSNQRVFFVFALLFLACAIQSQRGENTLPTLVALMFALLFVVCACALYRLAPHNPSNQEIERDDATASRDATSATTSDAKTYVRLLQFAVVVQLLFFVSFYSSMWPVAVLMGIAVLLDAPKFGLQARDEHSPRFSPWLLTPWLLTRWLQWRPACILVMYAFVCWVSVISDEFYYKNNDVYFFQQDGARALLQGVNPYALRTPSIYPPNTPFYAPELVKDGVLQFGYPYLPFTLLMAVPGFILGDVRYALLAAMVMSGWALMKTGESARQHNRFVDARTSSTQSSQIAVLAASLLLLFPHFLYLLVSAWCDSFVVVLFCVVVVCATRKSPWLPVAIGLWLASKQYVVLLLPLTWLLVPTQSSAQEKKLFYLQMIGTALLVSLPLILWNAREFVWSALELQFHQPLRNDALSFTVAYKLWTGIVPPFWIPFVLSGVGTWWALRTMPRNINSFCAACTMVFFLFIAFNKQAFINYYFVVFAMLCCTLCTFRFDSEEGVESNNEIVDDDFIVGDFAFREQNR